VAVDLDRTWEAVRRLLTDRGYDLLTEDRTAGVIETAWLAINADFTSNIFVTKNEDRYSDCGKPGLWKVDRGKHARLTVYFSTPRPGQTEMLVRAAFRTTRSSNLSAASDAVECRSRGRLEEEILVETQVRARGGQFQRFRRGGR
jgi:hypothetical protein